MIWDRAQLILILTLPLVGSSCTGLKTQPSYEPVEKIRIICIDSQNPMNVINNLESTSRRSGENNEVLTQWSWCKEV